MASKNPHRGRFQAQGDGVEKSVSWAQNSPTTKSHGFSSITKLENKLSPAELRVRQQCFQKANSFISRTSATGISAILKRSYTPIPPLKDIRVDIEVLAGIAFVDD